MAAERLKCLGDLRRRRDGVVWRDRQAAFGEEGLLGEAVLGDFQGARGGTHLLAQRAHRIHGHVLELVGDDIHRGGEAGERGLVLVGGDGGGCGDVARGRLRIGAVDVDGEAELGCGGGEHTPQLPAAQDADGGAGGERHASSAG